MISAYQHKTLADHFFPIRKSHNADLIRSAALVIGFSVLVTSCAQVSITIPNTIVPITLQTLGVLLVGATLGSRRGALTIFAYLAEGAAGAPVFAGGAGGLIHLIGPTAGYLWAFPIAAYVTGWFCEKGFDRNFKTSTFAMLLSSLVIYAFGVTWLAFTLHLSPSAAIAKGMMPFVLGDILKLLLASALLPITWKLSKFGKEPIA